MYKSYEFWIFPRFYKISTAAAEFSVTETEFPVNTENSRKSKIRQKIQKSTWFQPRSPAYQPASPTPAPPPAASHSISSTASSSFTLPKPVRTTPSHASGGPGSGQIKREDSDYEVVEERRMPSNRFDHGIDPMVHRKPAHFLYSDNPERGPDDDKLKVFIFMKILWT